MNDANAPPIAVTMGEPAGIGGELILKTWLDRKSGLPPFIALDDPKRLAALAQTCGLPVPVRSVAGPAEGSACFAEALPVLPLSQSVRAKPGLPSTATADAVIEAIERAVALAASGKCAALVTNPIQKKPLYDAGFPHPGHTEFLAALAGKGASPVMMLVAPGLRVVPATVHVPLKDVAAALDTDKLVSTGRATHEGLRRDFGIAEPRIAVAALNPHGGEDGAIGREEIDIIAPAVKRLRASGLAVDGPHPADTLFHEAARRRYDAVLCMYHDQALIPLKSLDFYGGVNVTLGLPFVRTSPDHGTALDIAGTGRADPRSLCAALNIAEQMARNRRMAADRAA